MSGKIRTKHIVNKYLELQQVSFRIKLLTISLRPKAAADTGLALNSSLPN